MPVCVRTVAPPALLGGEEGRGILWHGPAPCAHPDRPAIDTALVGGESCRTIASRYGTIGRMALERHAANHLPARLVKAQEAEEMAQADDLLAQVRSLQGAALRILDTAEQGGDLKVALSAIREARGNLELLAKLLGELDERPQVNILVAPEWLSMRTILLGALAPYPEARVAVAGALTRLEVAG
jgi:hypothetical protein